ncbi:MAG: hypothetical protein U0904_10275 [Candidatus Nanopelagicales bacterium]|nr:hypothetical protein [Candidatus Nanopelagicales bacterium]
MASPHFRVLAICSANICRSPAAETLLRRELKAWRDTVAIASAGLWTPGGFPACDLSAALVGTPDPDLAHMSRQLTVDMVRDADLIVTADRTHRAEIATIDPRARHRAFTLRQAAHLSLPIVESFKASELPVGAPALPTDPTARLRWLAAELDAGRGLAPVPPVLEPWDPEDVPDPHVLGYQLHSSAIDLIKASVADLVSAMRAVLKSDPLGTT